MTGIQDHFRYLPLSARSRRWGLFVTGCGKVEIPPHGTHPPSGHPHVYGFDWKRGRVLSEYQIILLTHGAGEFESTVSGALTIGTGEALVLFPGVWHRYRPHPETGWRSEWIGLGGTFVDNLVKNQFLQPKAPIITPADCQALSEDMLRVIELASQSNPVNPTDLSVMAMGILGKICIPDESDEVEPSTEPFVEPVTDRLVAEALRLIWNLDEFSLNVSELVDRLPVSRRSLERRFQQVLGRTVLAEITRCRVERVACLLEETNVPIKQLAGQAGFSGAEALTRMFHRFKGEAPATYRKRRRK